MMAADGRSGASRGRRPGVGVGVVVMRRREVLLVRRRHHGAGSWATPGGYLDLGESLEEAAARETLEETGITIRDITFRGVSNHIHADGKHDITLWLTGEAEPGEAKNAAPDEVSEVGWFAIDALPAPIYRSTRNLLEGRTYPADVWRGVIERLES